MMPRMFVGSGLAARQGPEDQAPLGPSNFSQGPNLTPVARRWIAVIAVVLMIILAIVFLRRFSAR
jgi:hypothetical protein